MLFRDREDAGRQLAERLAFLQRAQDLIVIGIPRGGVVVAAQVARGLGAPLDVFVAHKLGAPFNSELAIGAVTDTGDVFVDEAFAGWIGLSQDRIRAEISAQRIELQRRVALFRGNRPPLNVESKTAIVVDDGVATGSTMMATLLALRKQRPTRLILATPVGPPDTMRRLAQACDQVIVLCVEELFVAVGRFYDSFEQTTDDQVVELLQMKTPE